MDKTFTRVMILDTGEVCDVVDHLSQQFTVERFLYKDKHTVQFYFYADQGVTWKIAE